jgi:hypothetical protein
MLSSLNDLNSLNNLTNLNDLDSLISSKNFLNLMVPSTLPTKRPILVSQCWMNHQKPTILLILALFLSEAVKAMDVTLNQIQGS